jgi:hypothetical protein
MLPEKLHMVNKLMYPVIPTLMWTDEKCKWDGRPVLDTELLHLCWLVEETLTFDEKIEYQETMVRIVGKADGWRYLTMHATWQQRVIALAKVKGIEVV